ncbi:MAG: response regulator [Planctomycetota bacterium]|nr:response regulator [Planctomycetota bacterium]
MGKPLRLVIVEDNDADVELLLRELRRGGFELTHKRVQTADELHAALNEACDLVISDYSMPSFGAPAALEVVRERKIDVPFIVVSGSIGEDRAVGILKAGAHDFITKENLARLLPAIARELGTRRSARRGGPRRSRCG